MQFDINTLFGLLLLQMLMLALLLPVLMGWRVSMAARWVQLAALLQSLGWLGFMLANTWPGIIIDTLALAAMSAGFSVLWWALQCWLGPRPGRWLMLGAPIAVTLIYLVSYEFPILRASWANAALALQLVGLCAALGAPTTPPLPETRRWRGLLLGALLVLALVMLWHAATGILQPGAESQSRPLQIVTAVICHMALLAGTMALLVAWRAETEASLKKLAQTDPQTGLANRRSFVSRSVEMISMARRHREPLALVKFGLDDFAKLGSERGEAASEQALALFAAALQRVMRLGDLAGRLGSDEFGVLMARCEAQGPQALDKRLRDDLAQQAQKELGFPLAYSAGWGKLRPGDRGIEDLMRRADAAHYEAKGTGRLVAEPGLEE